MVKNLNILVVDNDEPIQQFFVNLLKTDDGFRVTTVKNSDEALKAIQKTFYHIIVTDLYMHGISGLQLLEEIKNSSPTTYVIIMTGFGSVKTAVKAIKNGAYDYFTKPLDPTSIIQTIKNVRKQIDLEEKNIYLRRELTKTSKLSGKSKELSKQIDNLVLLNSLTQALNTFTDLEELQEFVLEKCKSILGSQAASFFLVNENNPDELVLTAASGREGRNICGIRQKLGEGIAGQVALKKQPLLVEDINKDLGEKQKRSRRYQSRSFICVPLLTQNKLIGILNVTNKKGEGSFTASDTNLLYILAGHAASAVENIHNYNRIKSLNASLQHQISKAIHELKQKNEDLLDLTKYNENIINSISLGLIVFDKDLKITYFNSIVKDILQCPAKLCKSGSISDLELFDNKSWDDIYQQVIVNRKTRQLSHYEFKPADSPLLFLDIIVSPFTDEKDRPVGGILALNNVTDRVNMEQKLTHAERLAVVGKLAAKVAHELNNPLDGILRFVNLSLTQMSENNSESEIFEYLTESKAGLIRMAKIISSLLEFSRGMQPSFEKNQINDIVRDSIKAMSPVAISQNIRLITQLSDELPNISTGNFFQVLTNLIKNSIDAIGKGGTVYIRTKREDDNIIVEVEDNGKGFSKDIKDKIFDPFFTTKPPGKGSGLGLAICMGIIEEGLGDIKVESTPGKGTLFTISIPSDQQKLTAIQKGAVRS